jgi:hypothetical protein
MNHKFEVTLESSKIDGQFVPKEEIDTEVCQSILSAIPRTLPLAESRQKLHNVQIDVYPEEPKPLVKKQKVTEALRLAVGDSNLPPIAYVRFVDLLEERGFRIVTT